MPTPRKDATTKDELQANNNHDPNYFDSWFEAIIFLIGFLITIFCWALILCAYGWGSNDQFSMPPPKSLEGHVRGVGA